MIFGSLSGVYWVAPFLPARPPMILGQLNFGLLPLLLPVHQLAVGVVRPPVPVVLQQVEQVALLLHPRRRGKTLWLEERE